MIDYQCGDHEGDERMLHVLGASVYQILEFVCVPRT